MPSMDLDNNEAKYQIRSFTPGAIKINDITYHQSLIITPEQILENWGPQNVAEITPESLAAIVDLKPDVLLIGTGATLTFIKLEVYGELLNLNIGVEVMDTRAACRTYNALTAENRNVVAALIV